MKFFLSSTAYDLYDFRALVVEELRKLGHEVLYHEMPTFASTEPMHSHDSCLRAVESCDVLICILDKRYGGMYHGTGHPYIIDQKFLTKAGKKKIEITVAKERLSITWCEVLAGRSLRKPMLTFARKRLMDEKATRRANQRYKKFTPAYAENTLLFDQLDWLTHQETFNWITSFDSIVDFREQLIAWVKNIDAELAVDQIGEKDDAAKIAALPHVQIVVEGSNDRQFVKHIIEVLNIQKVFAVTVSNGKERAIARWMMQANNSDDFFDCIILLIDSDRDKQIARKALQTNDEIKRNLEKTVSKRMRYAIADPNLEQWILAGLEKSAPGSVEANGLMRDLHMLNAEQLTNLLRTEFDLSRARDSNSDLENFCKLLTEHNEIK